MAEGFSRRRGMDGHTLVQIIDERDFFHEDDVCPGERPAVVVDGLPALPGEHWRDYTMRALAWLAARAV